MAKLIICCGASGSGKSTWSKRYRDNHSHTYIVSRDDIRQCLFGIPDPGNGWQEQYVTKIEHAMIDHILGAGYTCISDNTNLAPRFARAIASRAEVYDAEIFVKTFDADLEVCLLQNQQRKFKGGRFVPSDVIEKQHHRYLLNVGHVRKLGKELEEF